MLPHFYYHPRMTAYDFGPRHPLKPERLRRTIELLGRVTQFEAIDPGLPSRADLLRVHAEDYLHCVEALSAGDHLPGGYRSKYGFGSPDNPDYPGMWEASLGYVGAVVKAAEAVRDGAPLAYAIAGGLHHAHRARASGFCIFNDPAVAISILRERFDRVAYVDIDVHHGDGVQWLFYEDHTVLTCSIHETGRTLFPATGFVDETGPSYTSINVPLEPGTTGDVWNWALDRTILPALRAFVPGAIVLQMGTDPHDEDPLGHLRLAAQEWLEAVVKVRDLGKPIVAVGGGGYNLTTVPRMWVAAILSLAGLPVPTHLPSDLQEPFGVRTFLDEELPEPRGVAAEEAERIVAQIENLVLPNVPTP